MKKLITFLCTLLMVLNVNASEKGSITINKAIVGDEYSVYKIMELETYDKANNHYIYRANPEWEEFLDSSEYLDKREENGEKYYVWKDVSKSALEFSNKAREYIKSKNIKPIKMVNATSTSVKFNDLDLGYYLVVSSVGSLLNLTTTNPSAVINEKNTVNPLIDKSVYENSTGTYGKFNDESISNNVKFKTTVVTGAGFENYIVYDLMDSGLDFIENSLIVKVNDSVVDKSNYKLNTNVKDYTFTVEFDNNYIVNLPKNTKIDIYYEALLNESAVIEGDGNVNQTFLEYGNKTRTDVSKTITYTYAFDLVKIDKDKKELSGAEFILLDSNLKEIKVKLVSDNTYVITSGDGEHIKVGKATIIGLDKGKYKLEEVVSPVGYNKLTSYIDVVINGISNTYERVSISVINYTGNILPETGGNGTFMFILTGSLITLISGLYLVARIRLSKENI